MDSHGPVAHAPVQRAFTMKGISFVNVRKFVLEEHGAAKLEEVMALLRPTDRSELASAVAVGWYDTPMFCRLLRAVDDVCGNGDLRLVPRLGAYQAEHDFPRTLRALMRVVSPESLFTMHHRLWRHFQSGGAWEMTHLGPTEMTSILRDFVVDEAICLDLVGYCTRWLEFTGAHNVLIEHPSCRARGGATCTFRASWR